MTMSDGVGDGGAESVGEGEYAGDGVEVGPPVGVAADEAHAPATMTAARATPAPRSLALPCCVGAGLKSLGQDPLANISASPSVSPRSPEAVGL